MLTALCDTTCSVEPPSFAVEDCVLPDRLRGGIIQTIISSCDVDWSDDNLADYAFWLTAKQDGKLKGTGRQKGGGFNFTASTEDTDACRAPELTGGVWTATIKDFNVILADGSDVAFWDTIATNPGKFQVGFRTPQDYFFGFVPLVISDKKLNLPDDCKLLFNREITFQWLSITEPSRKYLSFLNSVFPI